MRASRCIGAELGAHGEDATDSGPRRSARHGHNDCQIAVGRKNYLFAGSDEGARRAAIIYTIFGTCRLHNVDPWAYVRDVLEKLAEGWKQSRIDELLPPAWAESHAPRAEPATDIQAAQA